MDYIIKKSDLIKLKICKGTECASSNFASESSKLKNNIEEVIKRIKNYLIIII